MTRPRVGFLGVGWIGRHRMQAMLETGCIEAAAIADPAQDMAAEATKLAPGAQLVSGLDEMLDLALDGIVIATPSARHAEQSVRALESGAAVFCQKPLGRNADEVRRVIEAARRADRLLGVDLSYRHTEGMRRIAALLRDGALGRIFAIDLVFHNAYGPDKAWFYDPEQSGGGCVMDLGVHLVDLALWLLDFPPVTNVRSTLLSGGEPLGGRADRVEDYAVALIEIEGGVVVTLACSWKLPAGCDAVISASVYGTKGGASMRNVDGSFYDFRTELFQGTSRRELAAPPDDWGGRAAAAWAERLASGERFAEQSERFGDVAQVVDRLYGR